MIKTPPSSQRPNVKALQKQSLVMAIFSISEAVSKSDSAAQAPLQNQKPKVQRHRIQVDIKADVPKQTEFKASEASRHLGNGSLVLKFFSRNRVLAGLPY